MKLWFDEDEDLYEHARMNKTIDNVENAPDFDVPDDLWTEFREAQTRFFDLYHAVIDRSTPLNDEAGELQKRIRKGLSMLNTESA